MHHRMNEGCKVLGALQGVMKNRGLGMNVKKVRLLNICFMLSIETSGLGNSMHGAIMQR